jgi:uncharacterized protein YyaL (SSP411 family)
LKLPPIKLDFLKLLTDDTGILQHSKFATPRRHEGYTTDDNSRALIASVKYQQLYNCPLTRKLIDIYLSFLLYMQTQDGRFHNFLSYNRQFTDDASSEDSMGRALWACGCAIDSNMSTQEKLAAKEIFDKGLMWIARFGSLRSKAFAILGLAHYRKAYERDQNIITNIENLADKLLQAYKKESSRDWLWFEPCVTYVNGRLPQALFEAFGATSNKHYLQVAEKCFDFIMELQMIDDEFAPVGNKGWCQKNGERALFDQQSVEASCMVEAALAAYRATGDEKYRKMAYSIFDWFLGKNCKGAMIYNPKNGGCYDGITSHGLNLNQGAEATACYLMARLELEIDKRSSRAKTFELHGLYKD